MAAPEDPTVVNESKFPELVVSRKIVPPTSVITIPPLPCKSTDPVILFISVTPELPTAEVSKKILFPTCVKQDPLYLKG